MSALARLLPGPGRRVIALLVVAATATIHLISLAPPGLSSSELAEVRAATAQFHRTAAAQEAGWDLVEGLDHCFDHVGDPDLGAMGYHYINQGLLGDGLLDPHRPEALVYAPGPKGQLRLAAVEWILPGPADMTPPTVMGHALHHNATLGVWVLHAWVFEHNPSGMFEDWNPRVTCR